MIENKIQKPRLVWADYAKAIVIFLVVLGHANLSNELFANFLRAFRMPFFFLMAGYFDKIKEASLGDVIKKSVRTLIVPYLFFSVLGMSIGWIHPYQHPEIYHLESWSQIFLASFLGIFIGDGAVRSYAFMPYEPLWFLVSLFWIKIIFALLSNAFVKKSYTKALLIITMCISLYILKLPFFSIDSAMLALPFYVIGFLLKERNVIIDCLSNKNNNLIIAIGGGILLVISALYNGYTSIDNCSLGKHVSLFYFNGLLGSIWLFAICNLLPKNLGFINRIGKATLTILGTHLYILLVGKYALQHFGISLRDFPLWASFLLSIIAVSIGPMINSVLDKYVPWAIGKNKK